MAQNPQTKGSRATLKLQSDINSINRNQLNSSPSKMQYSIPKAKRFPDGKEQVNDSKFYDIPDTKSERATTLGYGNKIDLAKQNFMKPSPVQYSIKGQFQGNDKKRGITISAGRQVIKNNSVFDIQMNIPGPGQYTPKNPMLGEVEHLKGFSIASRHKDLSNKWIDSVPGPGNYETLQLLDKNLKSSNSRVQNVYSSRFNKEKRESSFEATIKQNVPGPGQYAKYDKLDQTAKFPVNHGFKFSHSQRQGIVEKSKKVVPGPGSYQYFSEFLH